MSTVPLQPGWPPPPPGWRMLAQSGPSVSYRWRFSGSDSTSCASLISLKRASAFASPLLKSGWNFRASLRNAALISLGVAVRSTPRIL